MAIRAVRRAVVAGGTGLVGSRLVAALRASGAEVRVLTRNPGRAALPPGCEARGWDDLPGALVGVDAVFNLCGEGIADRRWTAARKRALESSRIGPATRLAQALAALPEPPGVLVSASAVGFYGARDERPVTEAAPQGTGFLADLCGRWEAAAEAAAPATRVVRARLGVVLAREGGALPRMAGPVRAFLGAPLGHGRQGFSWIHADDLARLLLAAAADPDCRGPLNACAPEPVAQGAFLAALAARLGRPLLPVPAWLTTAGLRLLLGEMGEAMLLQGAFVLPEKALAMGFRFRFPDVAGALADLV